MIYLIKDVTLLGTKTIKIAQSDTEVLNWLSSVVNLKKFKGDIKIEKVML